MSVNIFGSGLATFKANTVDKKYVDSKLISVTKTLQTKLDKNIAEDVDMNGYRIHNFRDPKEKADAANKNYVDSGIAYVIRKVNSKLDLQGGTMTGNINMNAFKITNVGEPVNNDDAVNKKYVDEQNAPKNMYFLSTVGLVPHLSSSRDKSGFVVIESSFKDNNHLGCKAFNLMRNSEWRVADKIINNFWIELHCNEPVRIYKFTARTPVSTKLLKWKIQGGASRGSSWEDLPFTPIIPIEHAITYTFTTDPKVAKEYECYRLFVEEAEGDNPGLIHWQLYTVNPVLVF